MQGAQRLAVALAPVAAIVVAATCFVLAVSPSTSDVLSEAVDVVLAIPAIVLGLVVARRRPSNVVGALLVAMGLGPCVVGLLDSIARVAARRPDAIPGGHLLTALDTGVWVLWYLPVALLALFFADGRLLTPRWRVVAIGLPVVAIADGLVEAADAADGRDLIEFALLLPLLALLVATAVALVRRYRRADDVQRAQLTWIALAGMFLPITLLLCWASYLLLGTVDLVLIGLVATYLAIPAATTIAMLRHRLYDPGKALSTTVAYTAVTIGLVGVYAGVSAVSGVLAGRGSVVIAAVVTASCVIALTPARGRVQRMVDRRLYPLRSAALTALDELLQTRHLFRPLWIMRFRYGSGTWRSACCGGPVQAPANCCANSRARARYWSSWCGCGSNSPRRCATRKSAGAACNTSATRNGVGSNATCTTAPSSDW
ncbi:MAG TPA: hypothetical protein VGN81_21495 [Pseudonocardiaceae bacterium]